MSTVIIRPKTSTSLTHDGIKGMKWGVRRYQNPDGTLTELGKKRYGSGATSKQLKDAVKKDLASTDTVLKETGKIANHLESKVGNMNVNVERMDLSKMSDKEMRDRIAREQLERQYDQMFNEKRHSAERGRDTVKGIFSAIGTGVVITGGALHIALAIRDLIRGG